MYEQHWRYMRRIVELGDGGKVYARYNTNLSRVNYRGINLYSDILSGLRDWQICASLDGTGRIGEYIRTGLDYQKWLENFKTGLGVATHRRQMRIDFTLTLPGMFEVENIIKLAQELDVDVLPKVIFSFSPNIILSPLALPKHILHPWLDELIAVSQGAIQSMLEQLKSRPTFQEQWPNDWELGLSHGKFRTLEVEQIRKDVYTLRDILSLRPEVLEWYDSISESNVKKPNQLY
jgi:hypothetical protein